METWPASPHAQLLSHSPKRECHLPIPDRGPRGPFSRVTSPSCRAWGSARLPGGGGGGVAALPLPARCARQLNATAPERQSPPGFQHASSEQAPRGVPGAPRLSAGAHGHPVSGPWEHPFSTKPCWHSLSASQWRSLPSDRHRPFLSTVEEQVASFRVRSTPGP